jgi:23S rRNA (guanosine2251-2'-O)-methyltransferase
VASSKELLIGLHAISAALESSPATVLRIIVAEESASHRVRELINEARSRGVSVEFEPRKSLDSRSDGQKHQDLVAEFQPENLYGEKDLEQLLESVSGKPFVLVLDGVQDPHNLGACLRSASAGGIDFVILTQDRSAGLTPVARRAAAGAAESMPLLFATNLARILRQLKAQGVWLTGTSEHASQSLYESDLTGSLALVMGAEGKGLRRLTAELCDFLITIPLHGDVSSLNVSVATGICVLEAIRQRAMP